jgi:acyl dehydratase
MSITVGQRASRSLTLTADHVRKFAEISGDHNPLHFDAAFAARTKFGRLVVQGGLTTGLVHALVATDLPGPGTVFLSQNWKFTAPDTIPAEAEVNSVHPSKPVTELRVEIRRTDSTTVLEGDAWTGFIQPPCAKPPVVSSSGPPGACTTPSSEMNAPPLTLRMARLPPFGPPRFWRSRSSLSASWLRASLLLARRIEETGGRDGLASNARVDGPIVTPPNALKASE